MNYNPSADFLARIWVSLDIIEQIQVFVYELYPSTLNNLSNRSAEEWVKEHFTECHFRESLLDLLKLDKSKSYQIIMKGKIIGSYNYLDEYDEDLEIEEFQSSIIPDDYFDERDFEESTINLEK